MKLRTGLMALAIWALAGAAFAQAGMVHFFDALNSGFAAYYDPNEATRDAAGLRMFNVREQAFSADFRSTFIASNFPAAQNADYAIDQYSVDCAARQVGEHQLIFYSSSGVPLTTYDFGGQMKTPIPNSLKDFLVRRVCGG